MDASAGCASCRGSLFLPKSHCSRYRKKSRFSLQRTEHSRFFCCHADPLRKILTFSFEFSHVKVTCLFCVREKIFPLAQKQIEL